MRSLERRSSFEWEVSVPREHAMGPRLRSEIDEVIAKCIHFVEVLLRLSPRPDGFVSVTVTSVTSLLENGAHQQNQEKMKKLSGQHFENFESKLSSSVTSRWAFIDNRQPKQQINQRPKLIFPFLLSLFQAIEPFAFPLSLSMIEVGLMKRAMITKILRGCASFPRLRNSTVKQSLKW